MLKGKGTLFLYVLLFLAFLCLAGAIVDACQPRVDVYVPSDATVVPLPDGYSVTIEGNVYIFPTMPTIPGWNRFREKK